MVRIKPGMMSIFTKKYNFDMLNNYLLDLKKRTDPDLRSKMVNLTQLNEE